MGFVHSRYRGCADRIETEPQQGLLCLADFDFQSVLPSRREACLALIAVFCSSLHVAALDNRSPIRELQLYLNFSLKRLPINVAAREGFRQVSYASE